MTEYSLCAEGLTAETGGRVLLRDASFECRGLVGLFGRNGAGKTTLIRTLLGFTPKPTGRVYLRGDDGSEIVLSSMKGRERAKYLSYVPQDSSNVPHMKVIDFLVTGRTPYIGMLDSPKKSDCEKALEAAEYHRLTHLLDRYTDELSGGERRMVYLARSRVQGASWMLLDEPSAGLDYGRQREFFTCLRENCEKNRVGALVSLHDPHLCEEFCSAVLVMDGGKLYMAEDVWAEARRMYEL